MGKLELRPWCLEACRRWMAHPRLLLPWCLAPLVLQLPFIPLLFTDRPSLAVAPAPAAPIPAPAVPGAGVSPDEMKEIEEMIKMVEEEMRQEEERDRLPPPPVSADDEESAAPF
jgi:hypothetical protein